MKCVKMRTEWRFESPRKVCSWHLRIKRGGGLTLYKLLGSANSNFNYIKQRKYPEMFPTHLVIRNIFRPL